MPSRRSGRAAAKRAQQAFGTFAFAFRPWLCAPSFANRMEDDRPVAIYEPFPAASGFGGLGPSFLHALELPPISPWNLSLE